MSIDSDLELLRHSARISPVLRDAVARVAEEVNRLRSGGHTCDTTEPNCGVTPCVGRVADALQAAWDDFVQDTGCFPDALTVERGRNVRLGANFGVGNFSIMVASNLEAAGGR